MLALQLSERTIAKAHRIRPRLRQRGWLLRVYDSSEGLFLAEQFRWLTDREVGALFYRRRMGGKITELGAHGWAVYTHRAEVGDQKVSFEPNSKPRS